MDVAGCCSLTRRADFDFRRLENRAGWTPNFEWLGSGWRISILPRVLCVLSNEHYYLTHCLSITCIPLLSVQGSHSLYGNGGSRSPWQSCIQGGVQDLCSNGAFKFGVEAAIKSSRQWRREQWRFKSRASFQPFFQAHTSTHYRLPCSQHSTEQGRVSVTAPMHQCMSKYEM